MADLPFPLTLVMNNRAGFFFVNREIGAAVQRWTALDQFSDAVTLLDCMFDDLAYSAGDAVVLDFDTLAANPSEIYGLALIKYCLSGPSIRRVALVDSKRIWTQSAGLTELQDCAQSQGVKLVISEGWAEAVTELDSGRVDNLLLRSQPTNFTGSYGGSVYAWPELKAVVLTLSGNDGDLSATQVALQTGLQLCREKHAEIFILDSTSSAVVYDQAGYQFVQENLLTPLADTGLKEFIHVRTKGDKALLGHPVAAAIERAGIGYTRVGSLTEAMVLLDKLQGTVVSASHGTSAFH